MVGAAAQLAEKFQEKIQFRCLEFNSTVAHASLVSPYERLAGAWRLMMTIFMDGE